MIKRTLLFISLVILTSACSIYTINSQDTTGEFYPPKNSPNDVAVLDTIDSPHIVIATITVTTERNQRLSDVIEKMKREAAVLGGDAITNIRTDATGTWKRLPAQKLVGNGYVLASFTASVIVFK